MLTPLIVTLKFEQLQHGVTVVQDGNVQWWKLTALGCSRITSLGLLSATVSFLPISIWSPIGVPVRIIEEQKHHQHESRLTSAVEVQLRMWHSNCYHEGTKAMLSMPRVCNGCGCHPNAVGTTVH